MAIRNKTRIASGFTLIEILVAVSLFSFTILSATGLFKSVMDGQRSALSSQNIQESMRYALEVVGKEIRTAQASDGSCNALFNPQPTPANKIYNLTLDASDNQILYFKNQNDECVAYYLADGKMNIMRNYNSGTITSVSVKINSLKFFVIDNAIGSSSSLQPKVTIRMEAVFDEGRSTGQKINIQTSVSSREYAANTVNVSSVCASDCLGKVCGDDGCGGSCSPGCSSGEVCDAGSCVSSCVPSCSGKECGDDGCGGSCSPGCSSGEVCDAGSCILSCIPNCSGKECGDDGCGGSCGTCTGGEVCGSGTCLTDNFGGMYVSGSITNPYTNSYSCPSGYVGNSIGGLGGVLCLPTTPNTALSFGGMFTLYDPGTSCNITANPITGACSCPSGQIGFAGYGTAPYDPTSVQHVYCMKIEDISSSSRFGGGYYTYNGCPRPNPLTNACSCPSGYTAKRGSSDSGNPFYYCYK